MSAYSGDFAIAKILISKGANPISRNKHGDTPLHVALRCNQLYYSVSYINFLISATPKDNLPGLLDIENVTEKMTPYMIAVVRGLFDVATLLASKGLCKKSYVNKEGDNII